MRDAIVFSGWTWSAFNTPERMALAFAASGSKVLYCENPVSRLKSRGRPVEEVSAGVFAFGPVFIGHRLNRLPVLGSLQCNVLANQLLDQAKLLGLQDPLFVYPHLEHLTPLCREMKGRGHTLVHLCIDYPEPYQWEQIDISDCTLVVGPNVYMELRARYAGKVHLIRQPHKNDLTKDGGQRPKEPDYLASMPHPRLAYLGPAYQRLNLRVLGELLQARPEWQFATFGGDRCLPLPNVHCFPWCSWQDIPSIVDAMDVGFMPYDLNNYNLHCVPLKMFDYFAAGIPVVSTPIFYMRDAEDLVYVGETAEELDRAVQMALSEPIDSVKRQKRRQMAGEHSIEAVSRELSEILRMYDSVDPQEGGFRRNVDSSTARVAEVRK
jgi:Glycosyl transferases group 1